MYSLLATLIRVKAVVPQKIKWDIADVYDIASLLDCDATMADVDRAIAEFIGADEEVPEECDGCDGLEDRELCEQCLHNAIRLQENQIKED